MRTARHTRRTDSRQRRRRFSFGGIVLSAILFATTLAAAPASAESDTLRHPIWSEWEQNGDHILLGWRNWGGTEKVNVYRNDQYIATVPNLPIDRYRDYDGGVGDEYYLVAIGQDGQFSEKSNRVQAVHEEVPVPRLRMVAQQGSHISVAWASSADKINVYRNDQYIATVSTGNVYSDFSGRIGDEYYVIGVKDGRFSKKSEPKTAAGTGGIEDLFDAQIHTGYSPEGGGSASVWVRLPNSTVSRDVGIRSYIIYRNDRGRRIYYQHDGTRLGDVGVSSRVGVHSVRFEDPDPVYGATYGVLPVRTDGTPLSIVPIEPNYDEAITDFIESRQSVGRPMPPGPVPFPNPPNPNNPNDPSDWGIGDPRDPSNSIPPNNAGQSLLDLINAIGDAIDRVIGGIQDHIDDSFGPGTSAEETVNNEIDRLEDQGYSPMPGLEDSHMTNGEGSYSAISENGPTTTITTVTADWHDPSRPASVTVTEITENPDGSVTRTDNHISYQYPPTGPVTVSLNNEAVSPPAPTNSGGGGGGGGGGDGPSPRPDRPGGPTAPGVELPPPGGGCAGGGTCI